MAGIGLQLGRRIAPPRFVAFVGLLIAGAVAAIPALGKARGVLVAFDGASAVFLLSLIPLLSECKVEEMRARSRANDANRVVLLGLTGVVMAVILVALAAEMHGSSDKWTAALVIGTLVLAWLFSNTVYALHYAHLFYLEPGDDADENKQDRGGLDVPGTKQPIYWDFIYFAFTLGMTFQTSDVEISDRTIRRVVIGHCLAAFAFNIGVIAFTINLLGGGH